MAMTMTYRNSNDLWLKSCIVKGNMKLKCKKTLRNETHLKNRQTLALHVMSSYPYE